MIIQFSPKRSHAPIALMAFAAMCLVGCMEKDNPNIADNGAKKDDSDTAPDTSGPLVVDTFYNPNNQGNSGDNLHLLDRPDVPICLRACETPTDCVDRGNDAIHQAGNYLCTQQVCVYKGCNSNAECEEFQPGMDYKCDAKSGGCVSSCLSASDCVSEWVTADADDNNYTCGADRVCTYKGCLNDTECQIAYGSRYLCMDPLNTGIPVCQLGCFAPADCVRDVNVASEDADNWECIDERCYYSGCKNDEECGPGMRCINLNDK
jgi:hypothetical protein